MSTIINELVLLTNAVHGIIFSAAPACGKTCLWYDLKKKIDIVDLDDFGHWVYNDIFEQAFVIKYHELVKDKTRFYVGMDAVLNNSGLDLSTYNEVSKDFKVFINAKQVQDVSFVYYILTIEHVMTLRQRRFLLLHYKFSNVDEINYKIIEAGMYKRFDHETNLPYPGYSMYDSEVNMVERAKKLYHSIPYPVIYFNEVWEFISKTLKSDEYLKTLNPNYKGSF